MVESQAVTGDPIGPSLGHSWAQAFAAGVGSADLNGALQAYSEAPSWEDRWFCVEYASRFELDRQLLDSWCQGWPDHVLPFLTRGALLAAAGDPAAIADIERAAVLDPTSPIPQGLRLAAGRFMREPFMNLEPHLAEMMPKASLYEPHVHFLLAASASNGGSTSSMIDFARTVCEVVPAGSPLRGLMPLAAIDAMLVDQPADHQAYLHEQGLYDDVLMAAGQSVFHPDFEGQASVPSLKAMNAFLVALMLLGQEDLALMLSNRLGNSFTEWPLSLLGPATLDTWNELRALMVQKAPSVAEANQRA